MASYTVAAGKTGKHRKTLVAATVDTVTFTDALDYVEVYSDGRAELFFTADGTTPVLDDDGCHRLPAGVEKARVVVPASGATVVKLISDGTPTYSVQRP
jgi:hypothetical protein